jgi:hypothetical protein
MSEDKKAVAESKLILSEEMNLGFLKSIAKTNTEKITREFLEGLSEDTGDSDSYDVESGGEDFEDRPWRSSLGMAMGRVRIGYGKYSPGTIPADITHTRPQLYPRVGFCTHARTHRVSGGYRIPAGIITLHTNKTHG